MDRAKLRQIVAESVGNPEAGPVADAVDRIVDAVLAWQQPREQRIVTPVETRDE